jgi:two-component system sensor histidine kinase KdpD
MNARLDPLRVSPAGLLRSAAGTPATSIRGVARAGLVVVAALAVSTLAVAILETPTIGIADASPLYLVAVVVVGILHGTRAAVGTAVAAFAVYDVLFTEPRLTFEVADPREWLDLLLLLFVALVIGRLTARETERAREAGGRALEAEALFAISHVLATTPTLQEAAPLIVQRLAAETRMRRVWITARSGTADAVLADSAAGAPLPITASARTLSIADGHGPPHWIAFHTGTAGQRALTATDHDLWSVPMQAEGVRMGTLWGERPRALGAPGRAETRLLSLAADQLALAARQDQLSREATQAEVARQSDSLKSALLDSVSHDLRTPLASIRATAGTLMDAAVDWSDEERRSAAEAIDAEAERLSQLVQNVLDLSRIQGGALHPDIEVLDPVEVMEPVLARVATAGVRDRMAVELDGLPPVRADAVLLDTVLSNLLENAIRHAGPDAPIRISGAVSGDRVELVVEDGGVGVPDAEIPRLFGRFYRVPGRSRGSRPGLGIGLSIANGFVDAMGGDMRAERSELGGLKVRVRLPIAPAPPEA